MGGAAIHYKKLGTTREALWLSSITAAALARNANFPTIFAKYGRAGLMTRHLFREEAAAYITLCVSGAAGIQSVLPRRATVADTHSPMQGQVMVEICKACVKAKLTRQAANGIVNKLLELYDSVVDAPPGVTYQECFDVATSLPKPEYLAMWEEQKAELREFGLPIE
eukprot:NODE_1165_length_656_cov_823.710049_g913_i0.p1 GENE.NODE_1165_length_656_cov_823.710049_g913_i0~~NODE_1165_length_656_cov_823.710049_g913_i0.p1  ORF type:complete len:167 (+),score=18.65 NODE_1165_length_656_cov_823.710049_g913_i0:32-532(+)